VRQRRPEASVAATSEYGTARAGGAWLLAPALNVKTPASYSRVAVAFACSQETLLAALLLFETYFEQQYPLAGSPRSSTTSGR
jgi:hypothetical protein